MPTQARNIDIADALIYSVWMVGCYLCDYASQVFQDLPARTFRQDLKKLGKQTRAGFTFQDLFW